jgi:signal transduction histidine kinase
MNRFHSQSIRRKLIILLTATASLTVLIACVILWTYQLLHYRVALQTEESAMAQLVAESSAPALLFNDAAAANETLAVLRADPRIETACLYEKSGRVIATFHAAPLPGKCPKLAPTGVHFARGHLVIFREIDMQHELTGYLYLEVSLAEMYGLLLHFAETGVCVLLLTSFFALGLSSLLERIISDPIIHLTRVATRVSVQNDYRLRARRFSNDETGLLIDQFNAMMERIQERESELTQAHSNLEEKIRERTQDLRNEIAERKLVERDLESAKLTAEESSRAKSAFLANMSHELRTPLNAIIGYSEMLYEDAQVVGAIETEQDIAKVLSSARHLLSLISDVLDLSKIEAGQMKIHLETVLASNVLYEVLSTGEILARKNRNILQCAEDLWDGHIQVDPLRFRQCLLNLLSNACKFTEDGCISIAVRKTRVENKDWILWSVSDTGVGISPGGRAKLFQAFSQADSSITRRFGGSGLGLVISQQFCQAMGGHITVDSEPGVGSTFTLHIPACEAHDGDSFS